jgi:dihydrodipicolinate synthase/N-acetylneuraminate lyase
MGVARCDQRELAGLWGFVPTAFTDDQAIDLAAIARLAALQLDGGASVIVALGALAEADALDIGESARILDVVAGVVRGRVPLIVGVGCDDGQRALACQARACGASALLVMPGARPIALDRLRLQLRALQEASSLGLILYLRPPLALCIDDLAALVDGAGVIGIKDGTRDMRSYRRLRSAFSDRLLFAAAWEDMTLPYWSLGVDALSPASLAHDPWYAVAWKERLEAGDLASAQRLLAAFAYPFSDVRLARPGRAVAAVKEALAVRGLASAYCRPPELQLRAGERTRVRELVAKLDDLREA